MIYFRIKPDALRIDISRKIPGECNEKNLLHHNRPYNY